MEDGIVDRLVVAVTYAYDSAAERVTRAGLGRVVQGVGAASAAWAAMALEAAHAADAAHDAGMQVGLSAEEYSQWAYVVERAGGQVEHLRVGMTTLQRQLAAAGEGNDAAAKAFGRLGLGADVASGRLTKAADALPMVLDALAAIEDDGQRAALSLQVLGEAGPRLAGLLELGADGIDDLRQRADALGVTIREDVVQGSGDLVDALEDIGLYARGLSRDVGFSLVPALSRVATATRDWLVANDGIIDQQLDRTVGALGRAIADGLDHPVGRAALAAGALATAWGSLGAARSMWQALASAVPLVAAVEGQGAALLASARAFGPYGLAVAATVLALDDLAVAADGGDAAILRLAESIGARSEMQAALASTRDLLGEVGTAVEIVATVIGTQLAAAFSAMGDALRSVLPDLGPFLDKLAEVAAYIPRAELQALADRNESATRGFDRWRRYQEGDASVVPSDPAAFDRLGLAMAASGAEAAAPSVSVSVAVQAGPTAQQIADETARATRAEVLAAATAAGMR